MTRRANARCSAPAGAVGLKNTKRPAALLVCLSAMPSAAGGAGTQNTMDGQKSCGGFFKGSGGCCRLCGLGLRFSFFHEAQCGTVQVAQFGFARFVAGEFDEVATFQKFAKALFL